VPPRDEQDVFAAIAAGQIDPLYCLHGPERFLIDRCVSALKAAVLGPSGGHGLNHDAFELKETGLSAALNAAQTLPMFSKRRLVVGRGIDLLKSEELEGLADYAADPNPSTCLVLMGE
jgi:DNA polymerase-3 subunit delta